jgi:predicted permease
LAVSLTGVVRDLMFPDALEGAVPIDLRVLGATAALAFATGIVVGLGPAWVLSRGRRAALNPVARVTTAAPRLRAALAGVQLALSLSMLVGALLLVATLRNLRNVELGFDPEHVVTLGLSLRTHGYDTGRSLSYQQNLLTILSADPGFGDAAIAERAPFGAGSGMRVLPPGAPAGPNNSLDHVIRVGSNGVTQGYFRALRIPILEGRDFTMEESFISDASGVSPVIVDETLAERLFGTTNAVGRTANLWVSTKAPHRQLEVVGVVANSRWNNLTDPHEPFLYLPIGRYRSDGLGSVEIIVRPPSGNVGRVGEAVRLAAAKLDTSVPVSTPRPVSARVDHELREQRMFAWVLTFVGGLGFLLAGLGLHGLVAQTAAERTREFGIRLALGARHRDVVRLMLRFAAVVAGAGAAGGLVVAWFGTRLVERILFGVSALDARVYVAATVGLLVIVVLACLTPVLRTLRVQPVDVLRSE